MNAKVKHYFKTYTESNECFETSDGLLFHKETDAVAYANTLQDKDVKEYTRDEYEYYSQESDDSTLNDEVLTGGKDEPPTTRAFPLRLKFPRTSLPESTSEVITETTPEVVTESAPEVVTETAPETVTETAPEAPAPATKTRKRSNSKNA